MTTPNLSPSRSAALLLSGLALLAACGDDETPPIDCTTSADCPADQKCTPDRRCVAGLECVSDLECTQADPRKQCDLETFSCVFREPFGDECDALRPCAFGEFCSTLLGRCQDSASARDCARRAQCPAGQICDQSANKCIQNPGCYGDAFCEEGEICDQVSRSCVQLTGECEPCTSANRCDTEGLLCSSATQECVASGETPVCRTGEFCDILGRCVQCSSNDDCGAGLFCNLSLGRCESNLRCVNDLSDCPATSGVRCVVCEAPEICDPRTLACQAPPTECETDLDCAERDFCDRSLPVPVCVRRVPDCLNDLLEPNDNAALAAPLPPETGLFDELKLCPGDVDWYRLDLTAGTYLTVDARFRQSDGDLELQLFLADGVTLLDESRSVTDNERVEFEAGTDLTVLVRVFLAVPARAPPTYRLVVARDAGDVCEDDAFEDNDVLASAVMTRSDVPVEGRVCPGDADWFVLKNLELGQTVEVDLDFRHALGDLDLELHRAGSSRPLLRSASVTDDESLRFVTSFAGDHFLRVYGQRGDSNVYTLRAAVRDDGAPLCADDAFEPNNDLASATPSPEDTGAVATGLSICQGDDDFFRIPMVAGETVRAEIGFTSQADLELELYLPNRDPASATPIRASTGVSAREFLAYRTNQAGDHLLRVRGRDPAQISSYELRVDHQVIGACEPDAYDEAGRGNTAADAVGLGFAPLREDGLTICGFDQDHFRLSMEAGYRHILRIHYVDALTTLDLALLDDAGAVLAQTTGVGFDAKEIAVSVGGAGLAFGVLRVQNSGVGAGSPYSIVTDVAPLYDCQPDRFELNDARGLASTPVATPTVTPYLLEGLTLCALTGAVGDEDWFVLDTTVGTTVVAELEHDQGDLFLELMDPTGVRACTNAGAQRCFSDGSDLHEAVRFTTGMPGPYYLRVGSIYSSPAITNPPPDADTAYRLSVRHELP